MAKYVPGMVVHEEGSFTVRLASLDDAAALLEIYRPYVEETAITFECAVPSVEQFRERIRTVTARYPWLIAEQDEAIVGYAYAGVFKPRCAYDWSVETSVYVKRGFGRKGTGSILYRLLEDFLRRQGVRNMNACVARAEDDGDPRLSRVSLKFHERCGFQEVGVFHKVGFKLGKWYDMSWWEKFIGSHESAPEPLIPFPELETE